MSELYKTYPNFPKCLSTVVDDADINSGVNGDCLLIEQPGDRENDPDMIMICGKEKLQAVYEFIGTLLKNLEKYEEDEQHTAQSVGLCDEKEGFIWTTESGQYVSPKDMSSDHLRNACLWLQENAVSAGDRKDGHTAHEWYEEFRRELGDRATRGTW